MSWTFEELKDRMLQRLDYEEIIDVLGISVEDLLERFDDRMTRYYEDIEELLND